MAPKNIFFLLYPEVEILDFTGPHDVFAMANLAMGKAAPFNLHTIALKKDPIAGTGNIKILPDYCFTDTTPAIDALFIPGKPNDKYFPDRKELTQWIGQQAETAQVMASVCVGAYLLVEGMKEKLNGSTITTHHTSITDLRAIVQSLGLDVTVASGVRYTAATQAYSNKPVYASAGVAAGIDMALYLVSKWLGPKTAQATAKIMEFNRTINYTLEEEG